MFLLVKFFETRGRMKLPMESLQGILDVWFENSISTVDCRNVRESVTIRKCTYEQRDTQIFGTRATAIGKVGIIHETAIAGFKKRRLCQNTFIPRYLVARCEFERAISCEQNRKCD